MSNYINNISIYGMMNKLAFFDDDLQGLGFYKKKDKSKVAYFCSRVEDESKYEQINYMYLDEDPNVKGSHSTDQIISIIDKSTISLAGKKNIEIRETRNKYNNRGVEVRDIDSSNMNDVIDMIEKWRYLENGGWKYGFVEHAAIDKAIVKRYVDNVDSLQERIYAFSFYLDGQCVGYSTIEKDPSDYRDGIPEYKYLTRKVILDKEMRNLTEYVDWYTFDYVYSHHDFDKMLVNWGCSSGGVKWYKTHKWPLYCLEPKWFLTIKNNKDTK